MDEGYGCVFAGTNILNSILKVQSHLCRPKGTGCRNCLVNQCLNTLTHHLNSVVLPIQIVFTEDMEMNTFRGVLSIRSTGMQNQIVNNTLTSTLGFFFLFDILVTRCTHSYWLCQYPAILTKTGEFSRV